MRFRIWVESVEDLNNQAKMQPPQAAAPALKTKVGARKLTREDPPVDEILAGLDFVEEQGLVTKFDPREAARLMALPPWWPGETHVINRLKVFHIRKQSGSSWQGFNIYYKPALLELFKFWKIGGISKHIKDYMLSSDEYCALIDEQVATQAAQTVLQAHPELFQGSLSGRGSVQRNMIRHPCFDDDAIRAYAAVLPNERMARGYVFHHEGIIQVLRQSFEIVRQQYGYVPHVSIGWFLA